MPKQPRSWVPIRDADGWRCVRHVLRWGRLFRDVYPVGSAPACYRTEAEAAAMCAALHPIPRRMSETTDIRREDDDA